MPAPEGYIDVATRIQEFREQYPEGCLRPAVLDRPYTIQEVGDKTFIVVVAAAYRNPDDPTPGIGMAWEPFPGPTNFTRDSELQNAETSAWGRAIVAVGAADAKKVASANEVANRAAPVEVDLSEVEAAIADAEWENVAGDWNKTRTYARQSQQHADLAAKKVREQVAASKLGGGE